MPTPHDYVDALRRNGQALADAARTDLSAPVPSCPGWSMADLVRHTGEVHRNKLATVDAGGTQRPERLDIEPAPADDEDLLSWYSAGLAQLADRLGTTDPQQGAWSWAGDHRVAFWQRRMAQETLIHRWDAQASVGAPDALPSDLAEDGIDEYLRIFLDDPDTPPLGPTGMIAVQAADTGRSWTMDTTTWPPAVSDDTAPAVDVTISGSAEDVLLVLWRRRPLSAVTVSGNSAVLTAVLDAADL